MTAPTKAYYNTVNYDSIFICPKNCDPGKSLTICQLAIIDNVIHRAIGGTVVISHKLDAGDDEYTFAKSADFCYLTVTTAQFGIRLANAKHDI